MTKTPTTSCWTHLNICTGCEKQIGWMVRFHSGGVCPYCGNYDQLAVVPTRKLVGRWVRDHPWWMFWKRPRFEVKA